MNLWILRPRHLEAYSEEWYDKSFGFVVRAETQLAARDLIARAKSGGAERDGFWQDTLASSCEPLSHDGPEEIVMRDFWAA